MKLYPKISKNCYRNRGYYQALETGEWDSRFSDICYYIDHLENQKLDVYFLDAATQRAEEEAWELMATKTGDVSES